MTCPSPVTSRCSAPASSWRGSSSTTGDGRSSAAFGGPGITQAAVFFGTVAHLHPATFFAALSGTVEFFGGIAVGLGIFGRLAAAGLVGDMVIAMVTVTFGNGIAANAPHPGGGYELNLALLGVALVVAILGTGRFSLDVVIRNYLARRSGPAGAAGGIARPAGTGSPRPPD